MAGVTGYYGASFSIVGGIDGSTSYLAISVFSSDVSTANKNRGEMLVGATDLFEIQKKPQSEVKLDWNITVGAQIDVEYRRIGINLNLANVELASNDGDNLSTVTYLETEVSGYYFGAGHGYQFESQTLNSWINSGRSVPRTTNSRSFTTDTGMGVQTKKETSDNGDKKESISIPIFKFAFIFGIEISTKTK